MHAEDDPEIRDPGLARERTALSWTRTAISVAAVGGAILKNHPLPGVIVLALSPVVWLLGRIPGRSSSGAAKPERLLVITVAILAISCVAFALALTVTHGPHIR